MVCYNASACPFAAESAEAAQVVIRESLRIRRLCGLALGTVIPVACAWVALVSRRFDRERKWHMALALTSLQKL